LPEGAVIDEITAEYKNGTLKITVPVDRKKQKRSIEIK
jgi:HSP20 family molecular chaperone IbpA